MKDSREHPSTGKDSTKKGYNEKNPGQPQGAFPPQSDNHPTDADSKSNTADKKEKEDQEDDPV